MVSPYPWHGPSAALDVRSVKGECAHLAHHLNRWDKENNVIYFYQASCKAGFMSPMQINRFTTEDRDKAGNLIEFLSLEHYFHWQKALFVDDKRTAGNILLENRPDRARHIRRGLKMTPEQIRKWDEMSFTVAVVGLCYKFTTGKLTSGDQDRQYGSLKEALLSTGHAELVKAMPGDARWGIGEVPLPFDATQRENWGLNLMGKAVMRVRDILREEAEAVQLGTRCEMVEKQSGDGNDTTPTLIQGRGKGDALPHSTA